MAESFALSVVTPTFNRKRSLQRLLAALGRQTVDSSSFEVVIVDDGSTDGTLGSIEAADYGFALQLLQQANSGPARARNRGIEAARGKLILFLDDDVEPAPDLIEEHLKSHAAEQEQLVVVGPLSSLPHYAQPWVAWEQAKIEEQYAALTSGKLVATFRQFWTGNASLAKAHLVALGGFNAEFLRGEDVELGCRLHGLGLKFRFNAKASVLHHAERSLDSWCKAHQSYGRVEVEIFGQLGQDELVEVLAGNLSRLHAGTQWVLRACFGRPKVYDAVTKALRTWLQSAAAAGAPAATEKICSVLANVLYWRASAEALGEARFASLRALADQIRARGDVVEFGSIPGQS
jgi:GT2 family glycosyltransferase